MFNRRLSNRALRCWFSARASSTFSGVTSMSRVCFIENRWFVDKVQENTISGCCNKIFSCWSIFQTSVDENLLLLIPRYTKLVCYFSRILGSLETNHSSHLCDQFQRKQSPRNIKRVQNTYTVSAIRNRLLDSHRRQIDIVLPNFR
jgi:hypothetical protein